MTGLAKGNLYPGLGQPKGVVLSWLSHGIGNFEFLSHLLKTFGLEDVKSSLFYSACKLH